MVSSKESEVYQEDFEDSASDVVPEVPSVLSTLPVALVVEQTARILEDIKKENSAAEGGRRTSKIGTTKSK